MTGPASRSTLLASARPAGRPLVQLRPASRLRAAFDPSAKSGPVPFCPRGRNHAAGTRETTMQNQNPLTTAELDQFTGTEHWYRHGLIRHILFTDGARYLAERAGAFWLLDEIAIAQRYEKAVAVEPFQVWKLKVRAGRSATLCCEDGDGKAVYTKPISFTDFPLPEVALYFTDNVILLPSEY
jgi:hypothetical protein